MIQSKKMHDRARVLRNNMTPEERKLWYGYIKKQGKEFRRQHIYGKYILDFYCREAMLVIEIDGMQHLKAKNKAYDEIRTRFLNSRGLKVIRFMNSDVRNNFSYVCDVIWQVVEERCGSTYWVLALRK